MGRLAYGEVSREKTCQLLAALLDFSNDYLDPDFSEYLRKKGLRCHHADWHTEAPKLDLYSPRPLLIELVQFRYQSQALIDSKPKLKETLDHLEQTVQCLRLRGKKQGRQIIDGTFSLWSTDTDVNLSTLRSHWPEPHRRKSAASPQPEGDFFESPKTDTPFSDSDTKASTSESSEGSSETARDNDAWDDLFDQFADLLKEALPHSPFFRAVIKLFGIDPQARITSADRQYLLQRVQKMWLKDYLQNALRFSEHWQTVRIDLTHQPSALAQYRNILWENPQQLDGLNVLPPGTKLSDQFNAISPLRRLLILGAPGSGKTIALLELLQALYQDAQSQKNEPIPVVFNLSTYGLPPEGRNFTLWLVAQLEQQYSLSAARGRRFIESQKLLLLLDGLDEVRSNLRNICIRQINQFLRTYRHTECIICSRLTEYEAAYEALQLEASLKLRPLTPNQAIEYLRKFSRNHNLDSLIHAIQENTDFQQLAETPLMLNVMALAYQNQPMSDLQHFTSLEDHRAYLYDAVLERLLHRKQSIDRRLVNHRYGDGAYSQEEIRAWLIWLAKRMVEHDQTTFFIEQLHPGWLETRRQRQGHRLNSHILVGILTGIISVCHMTPLAGWQDTGESIQFFWPLLGCGVASSVLASVLFIGLRQVIPQLLAGFMTASVYVLGYAFLAYPFIRIGPTHTYISRLSPIAIDWLGMALFWGLMRNQMVVIHKVTWSWLSTFRFMGIGCLAYLCLYLPVRLFIFDRYREISWPGAAYELFLIVVFTATYGGLALGDAPEPEDIALPNQGMRSALRNAGLLALVMGGVGTLAAWQYAHGNPYEYAMIAVAIGLFAALLGGQRSGQVLIQHLILRIILWWNRYAPWNYARFLNFVTQRMVLRRAGGGYLFMHRSLMEHLAKKA